jgi:hypothetical protein
MIRNIAAAGKEVDEDNAQCDTAQPCLSSAPASPLPIWIAVAVPNTQMPGLFLQHAGAIHRDHVSA